MVGVKILTAHMQLAIDQRQITAGDGADQWIVRQGKFLYLLLQQITEQAGRARKSRWFQLLIAKHQHRVFGPDRTQTAHACVTLWHRQINALDFCAKVRRQWLELEIHTWPCGEGWK